MSAKLRTILLVSLVTVLIWLWAEGESLSTTSLNPSVEFVHDPDLLLEPDPDWRGTVRLRLQGSTRALTEAENAIGSRLRLRMGQGGVPAQPAERQIIDLEDAIRQLPEIRAAGLSVQEVTPAITVLRIERLIEREIPVRAAPPPDVELLGEPSVQPARVAILIPENLSAQLAADAFALAPLSREQLAAGRDDVNVTISTSVVLPEPLTSAPRIKIIPDKVNVSFRLKRGVDSVTLASSPVWFALPPTEGNKWDIDLTDQFLRDVTFTGPTDSIAKIRSREVIPIAEVRLLSDELERGIETKEAVFVNLPPGVESGVAVKTVRLKITRRKTEPERDSVDLGPPDPVPAEAIDQE